MTDLAALGLVVTSDRVLVATDRLQDFRLASDSAGKGADQLGARSDKLNAAMKKLDATAGGVNSVLKDAASRYDQLRSSVDPAFAASQKYADIQRELAAMVESGGVTQRQANIVLEQAASRLMGVSTAAERTAQAQRELEAAADQARSAMAQQVASLDALRASVDPVYASSKRYEQALKQLDAALEQGLISQRQYNTILGQAEAAYLQAGSAAGQQRTAMDGLLRSSQGGAGGLQNVGFQVQDFAVQVAAGTSATQALAQQLPQLLSGFGLLGIGLGTAAAVLIPIAGYFLANAEAAKTFDEAIGDLGVAIDDLQDALDIANAPLSELIEEFGTGAVRVREMNAALAELLMLEALDSLDTAMQKVNEGLDGVSDRLEIINSSALQGVSGEFVLARQVRKLNEEFGLTVDQAEAAKAAMDALENATGAREQADAARALADTLLAVRNEAGQIPPELRETARAALQAAIEAERIAGPLQASVDSAQDLAATSFGGDWLGTAIARAQTLAGALWSAVSARNAAGGTGTGEGGPGMTMGSGDWMNNSLGFTRPGNELLAPAARVPSGGGGGGGGSSGGRTAVEEYTEAQKRALKVIGEVNEASVTQAEVIAALEEMYASGAITSDQLATAIGNVKDQFSELETVSFSLSEGLAGVFTDALTGAKSLQDGLQDLLKSMSSLFLNAAFKSFLGGVFPNIDFGGFRAGGGGVTAGRSYIVGERGPELFTPGRSGGITPNSAMRGGGTMVQINNYSGAPVREQRSTGPDGRELVKVIVGEELGSGGYDKQLGRYGSTPAKVKR